MACIRGQGDMGFHLNCLLHVLLKCFIQYYVNSSPALVLHIYVSESGHHWLRKWLVAYSAPSHYLNQWWVIVNWTLRNKLQWNFNQNIKLFIYENASENIVYEMAAILSREGWVKLDIVITDPTIPSLLWMTTFDIVSSCYSWNVISG